MSRYPFGDHEREPDMDKAELERVRDWATGKLATGEEPPWSFYQHMKLIEALDEIVGGMEAATPLPEDSPRSESPRDSRLRLVADNGRQENARSRRGRHRPAPLPM